MRTDIQSSFMIFSRKLSRGVFSCRNRNTTTIATAQIGRFMSGAMRNFSGPCGGLHAEDTHRKAIARMRPEQDRLR